MTVRGLAACVLPVLLAACAAVAPQGEPVWRSGRLSLQVEGVPAGAPSRSLQAGFETRGDAERGQLVLNSPLGTRLAAVRWAPGLAVMTGSDGERRFDSLDALCLAAFGEVLPLAAWPDWLAGRPSAVAAHRPVEGGFEQLGWRVGLARYSEGWIDARREAAPALTLRVRLDRPEP